MAEAELAPVEAPRSSPEKITGLMGELQGLPPDDEETAQLIALFQMVGPIASRFIPQEPEQLDRLLLAGARWALALLSDPAAVEHGLDDEQLEELRRRVAELTIDTNAHQLEHGHG